MQILAMDPTFAASYLEAIENASTEERAAALDRFDNAVTPDVLSLSEGGTEAIITIAGPLSPKGPGPIARFFGFDGTAYNDVIAAAKMIEANPSIKRVRLHMDTPGGTVNGMDQARQAVKSLVDSGREVIAENHGMIASAGYHIATAATRIEAMSALAKTGSIGVIIAGFDYSKAEEKYGIKRVRIVSKNAPDKQPDPTTAHGLEVLQEQVDAVERVFIAATAEGRNTTTQDVIDNFGRGGILIAQDPDPSKPDAVSVGMIDAVRNNGNIIAAVNGGGEASEIETQQEGAIMDLNQLKAEHPAIFAEAVAIGVKQERERAEAHITLGEASGDMNLAIACVKDGSEMTALVSAKYTAAGMKNQQIADRGAESEGDLGAAEGNDLDDNEAALAAATAELLGVEING